MGAMSVRCYAFVSHARQDLENFLTIDSLGCCFDDELLSEEHNHDHDDIGSLPGGLSHADVRRWYAPVQNVRVFLPFQGAPRTYESSS